MPSTGFYPFLRNITVLLSKKRMCQCPQRASTHFYIILFSLRKEIFVMCQCPQRASTHFYKTIKETETAIQFVSMPSTGFYSFLLGKKGRNYYDAEMCQCPQRASTHFYGSLSKALILLASEG